MTEETKIIEAEVISLAIPDAASLPPSLLANIEEGFKGAFAQAEKWRQEALAINITDPSETAKMKIARQIRLDLKDIRVGADKKRKALKENVLLMGRAIDGTFNLLLAAIKPLEDHLEEQEKFVERMVAKRHTELQEERAAALQPFLEPGFPIPVLSTMEQAQWDRYLADAKFLHETKVARQKQEEADRLAREQAEAAERERQRLENIRLKEEAEAKQREFDALQAKLATERKAAEEDRVKAEAEARKKQAEADAKLEAERQKAEQARIAAEAEAKKLRDAAEAKAKEEAAARQKAEQELAERKAAEDARLQEEANAQAAKARAPDKDKILDLARQLATIEIPEFTSPEGIAFATTFASQNTKFIAWTQAQAAKL